MAYASRTAAPATASGLGSDAGMREAASKRPAAAAGLGDGDRPVRSPTAAAPPEKHGALQLHPPPPPPTTDNNLIKEDPSLRVLVLQPDDGSKISGEADTEDYMTLLRAQDRAFAGSSDVQRILNRCAHAGGGDEATATPVPRGASAAGSRHAVAA